MMNIDLLKAIVRADAATRMAMQTCSALRTYTDLLHEMLESYPIARSIMARGIQNVESGLSDIALAVQSLRVDRADPSVPGIGG